MNKRLIGYLLLCSLPFKSLLLVVVAILVLSVPLLLVGPHVPVAVGRPLLLVLLLLLLLVGVHLLLLLLLLLLLVSVDDHVLLLHDACALVIHGGGLAVGGVGLVHPATGLYLIVKVALVVVVLEAASAPVTPATPGGEVRGEGGAAVESPAERVVVKAALVVARDVRVDGAAPLPLVGHGQGASLQLQVLGEQGGAIQHLCCILHRLRMLEHNISMTFVLLVLSFAFCWEH